MLIGIFEALGMIYFGEFCPKFRISQMLNRFTILVNKHINAV
jgi:hypothetical protein